MNKNQKIPGSPPRLLSKPNLKAKAGNAHLNSEGGSISMVDLLVLTG